jgi:16S rRNA (guanine966-N2)-methyltransferase
LRGTDIRPTSDRLRETLFNVLCAGNPDALAGSTWLDLYAGTGAVGIEALSRSARMVHFVESSKAAADLTVQNLNSLGITTGFRLVRTEVKKALRSLESERAIVDFVFLDPPYRTREEYGRTLETLGASNLLRQTGLVIAEHEKKFDPGESFGRLQRYRRLDQGDASLSFYRLQQ